MDIEINKMELMDGRTLAWSEFGDPNGLPVLYSHGAGASLVEGAIFRDDVHGSGIRLIAPSRPGAWHSTPKPGRIALDYAGDVVELTNHLGIDRFVATGNSNGGLFTMAIAYALPDRVIGAVPINSTSPLSDPAVRRIAPRSLKAVSLFLKYTARLTAPMMRRSVKSQKARDRAMSQDIDPEIAEMIFESMAYAHSDGIVPEIKIAMGPWGFDHRAIRCPVRIVYAEQDTSRYLGDVWASELPDGRHITIPGGHVPTLLAARQALVSTWRSLGPDT